MNLISMPSDRSRYPDLVANTVMEARMALSGARLGVSWHRVPGGVMPEVAVHFVSEWGGKGILRYHLPPDTPERTERRVALLLRLIRKELGDDNAPAEA